MRFRRSRRRLRLVGAVGLLVLAASACDPAVQSTAERLAGDQAAPRELGDLPGTFSGASTVLAYEVSEECYIRAQIRASYTPTGASVPIDLTGDACLAWSPPDDGTPATAQNLYDPTGSLTGTSEVGSFTGTFTGTFDATLGDVRPRFQLTFTIVSADGEYAPNLGEQGVVEAGWTQDGSFDEGPFLDTTGTVRDLAPPP
jgi:hypothetical protein